MPNELLKPENEKPVAEKAWKSYKMGTHIFMDINKIKKWKKSTFYLSNFKNNSHHTWPFIFCSNSKNSSFFSPLFFSFFISLVSIRTRIKKKRSCYVCMSRIMASGASWMRYFLVRVLHNKAWLTLYKIRDAFWSADLIKARYLVLHSACI